MGAHMDRETKVERTFVGIDVAKRTLEVALGSGRKSRVFNGDAASLKQLVEYVRQVANPHVCLEATGGYERELVNALALAKIDCTVLNPLQARQFIRCSGKLDKTDRIDAQALALFGERMQPEPTPPPSAQQARLKELQARREQVLERIQSEKNRLDLTRQRDVQRLIQDGLRAADKELKKLNKLLRITIEEDDLLRQNTELLCSVPGIGQVSAANLLALVPELGRLTRRKIARLAGLAPVARDSGEFRGRRFIGGGRPALRKVLYMPTMVAVKHNSCLREFYQRLLKNGKPKMLALTAAARKLLTILNSIIQRKEPWKNTLNS
jgi:transposase